MTVSEAIATLQKCNPDAELVVSLSEEADHSRSLEDILVNKPITGATEDNIELMNHFVFIRPQNDVNIGINIPYGKVTFP